MSEHLRPPSDWDATTWGTVLNAAQAAPTDVTVQTSAAPRLAAAGYNRIFWEVDVALLTTLVLIFWTWNGNRWRQIRNGTITVTQATDGSYVCDHFDVDNTVEKVYMQTTPNPGATNYTRGMRASLTL